MYSAVNGSAESQSDCTLHHSETLGQKSVQKISDIQCSVGGPSETETNLKATYIIYMVWTAWPLSS